MVIENIQLYTYVFIPGGKNYVKVYVILIHRIERVFTSYENQKEGKTN